MVSDQDAASQHAHPGTGTYLAVAAVLTIITLVEVGVFYVPAFKAVLAPVLITLSATKFALVVMFYMHLKSDSKLFTLIFSLPLLLALGVAIALLFLYGAFVRG
ncbi:MAG: cytochrome C oxidase subunit IV family protein [Gemmatimonadetes bacterium]|nr:cytochrome C oxidase subunit IV family protein [Gemmatimonadota bacterium]